MLVALIFTLGQIAGLPWWQTWLIGVALWALLMSSKATRGYGFRLGVAYDREFNVSILNGSPDETVSQRAAFSREQGKWWACKLCRLLDWFDKGHCAKAIDELRRKKYRIQG